MQPSAGETDRIAEASDRGGARLRIERDERVERRDSLEWPDRLGVENAPAAGRLTGC